MCYSSLAMKEPQQIRLSRTHFPEKRFSMSVSQSAIGLCYTLQLLDLKDADRARLSGLISDIASLSASAVLSKSILDFVRETRAGERDRQLQYENIGKAIIGLSRTVQLLDSYLTREDRSLLHSLCLDLMKLAEVHSACLGSSAIDLMLDAFAGAADPQDSQDYLAQEPQLQAAHGINGCGAEPWDSKWDEK